MADPRETSGPIAVVTGGSGYIGRFLIRDLLSRGGFAKVINLDLRRPAKPEPGEEYRQVDLRSKVDFDPGPFDPASSWIFNFAAACREPGFEPREYFDINAGGAETVTAWAAEKGFRNIFFTSTMSTYGRMAEPTPEWARQYPETPYGISKVIAEGTHREWLAADPGRRLVICRPGVIFGPDDNQNISRMIKAVKRGYFVFPGDPGITKAYGYVHGLVDSIHFVLARTGERFIVYNYAENPLLPLSGMVREINAVLGTNKPIIRVPMGLLVAAARGVQLASGVLGRPSPIHPVRVRKVGFPTHLLPQYLIDRGFIFKYPFDAALRHWKSQRPEDL